MAQEVWSKRVYDHPGFTLGKDMRVIDIGANQGFFSTYAASFGARVYAFEPSSENFEMLQRNLSENACGSLVTPFRVAVAGKRGRMTLYVGLDSKREILSGTASITNTNRGGVDILHENDIAFCDFLKMDCEGAEYEILQSTSAEAFNRIGRLSMETHEGRGREAVHLLRARGYEIMEFEDRQAGILKARRSAISR
jgi:FkbM family methyltransferase